MTKITYTTETLYHFNCGACGGWWTVGDAPVEGETWFCTWCGYKAAIEPSAGPVREGVLISPASSSLAAMILKRAIDKGKTIGIPSLGIKIEPDNLTSQDNP